VKIYQDKNTEIFNEKEMIEGELNRLRQGSLNAEQETTNLISINKKLVNERVAVDNCIQDIVDEIRTLRAAIETTNSHFEAITRDNILKEEELNKILRDKKERCIYADQLKNINDQYIKYNKQFKKRIEETNSRINSVKKEYDNTVVLLDKRQKELTRVKVGLSFPRISGLEASGELRKLRQENSNLQKLLDQYRKDIDFQKKLHEIEVMKKQEMEIKKKELENKALNKHIEVITTIKKLKEVKDVNDQLLGDKEQMGTEINALKQHTELLHTQNLELHNELEKFVDTDRQIKEILDRKKHLEYLKNKNSQELRHSVERIRNSLSPSKKSNRSMYSPNKEYS